MFKIGFSGDEKLFLEGTEIIAAPQDITPRASVVQVRFPGWGKDLSYYNDQFDVHPGDKVYVDGKLEGIQGRVTSVSYCFKIDLAQYKRVISRVDTDVHGQFFAAGSHFITFDRNALPKEKARTWFFAPASEDSQFVSSYDEEEFPLDDLEKMGIEPQIASRGHDYYLENNVRYISVDDGHGYAIVEGTKPYEVEFTYRDGMIGNLVCSCFCGGYCKHEFATLLQLKELLERMDKHYSEFLGSSKYFAAIFMPILFQYSFDGKETGSMTL